MWQEFPLWPARASTFANRTDALFIFLIAVTGFFTVMVFIAICVFAFRYRASKHPVPVQIEGSNVLETTWTIIPFGVFMIFFIWGASIYMAQARPPENSMEIFGVAKQWMWKFEHPEGVREINTLHVPVGRDVRVTLVSQDVIHDFFVPAFRIKQDVLPGRYVTTWFHAVRPGSYHLFCSQYCGTMHSGMIGEVIVMEPGAYQAWLSGGGAEGSLASTGQKLFQQYGCASCHRSDTQGRGPHLEGVYGKPVLLSDGRRVMADDDYVRESILNPSAKIVGGFQNIMPSFNGVISEEELLALIAYVKSLAQPGQGGVIANMPLGVNPVPPNANPSLPPQPKPRER